MRFVRKRIFNVVKLEQSLDIYIYIYIQIDNFYEKLRLNLISNQFENKTLQNCF